MGNCLDVPEDKGRRRAGPRRHKRRANVPVILAAPPEMIPVMPQEYYPVPLHQPYQHYAHEIPTGSMAVLVDPSTGQEYLMPYQYESAEQQAYSYYYDDYPSMDFYDGSAGPNGIGASRRSSHHHHHHHSHHQNQQQQQQHQQQDEDDVDKGEARALRKKSREERKLSQGQEKDKDKVDILDVATFSSPAIIETSAHLDHVTVSANHTAPIVQSSVENMTGSQIRQEMDSREDPDPLTVDMTDSRVFRPSVVTFDNSPSTVIQEIQPEITEEFDHGVRYVNGQDEVAVHHVLSSKLKAVQPAIYFSRPATIVDVVITYSTLAHTESDIVRRLSSLLKSSGISVWAERLGDSFKARKSDKTAKAILGAKVVVLILSEGSCHQRFVRDHVALATVMNATIFPVTTQPPPEVMEAMPAELKLQVPNDPADWTELGTSNEDRFLFDLRALTRSIADEVEYGHEKDKDGHAKRIYSGLNKRRRSSVHYMKASTFWDVHFGHRHSVKWERMQRTIEEEYYEHLKLLVDGPIQQLLFIGLKKKVCEDNSDTATKDKFTTVCTHQDEDSDVWETVLRVGKVEQAIRDIFDSESTVRNLVLDNAESLGYESIIGALCHMACDKDANVRAMSAVSLSCCVKPGDVTALAAIVSTLKDEDRLVREAGCLALGNLKMQSAVAKLIHLWRNDFISQVREAASMALAQLNTQEVEEAMRVTKVLSDEIRMLTAEEIEE